MSRAINRRDLIRLSAASTLGLIIPNVALANNIHSLSGSVFINTRRASHGDSILPGDLITTSHTGSIAFTVGADAFLLKENTSVQVGEMSNPVLSLLQLLTGKLLGAFETGRNRRIVTANATIGIRGTACFLNSTPDNLYYCNCYGKTSLTSGDRVEHFEATQHSAFDASFVDGVMTGVKSDQVLDHTDDELRMLEALVGRVPLFDRG